MSRDLRVPLGVVGHVGWRFAMWETLHAMTGVLDERRPAVYCPDRSE
jgi:hypothetical protein